MYVPVYLFKKKSKCTNCKLFIRQEIIFVIVDKIGVGNYKK